MAKGACRQANRQVGPSHHFSSERLRRVLPFEAEDQFERPTRSARLILWPVLARPILWTDKPPSEQPTPRDRTSCADRNGPRGSPCGSLPLIAHATSPPKDDPMSPGGPLVILNADDLSRLALKTPAQGSQTGFHLRSRPKSRPYRARWRALLPRVASALAFPSTRILLSLSPGPLAYLRVRFHALTA